MIINIKVLLYLSIVVEEGVEKLETTIQIIFTFKLNLRCLLILAIHFKCKLFVNLTDKILELLKNENIDLNRNTFTNDLSLFLLLAHNEVLSKSWTLLQKLL